MSITRGELKSQILTLINKNASYSGFITDDKLNDAIEDSLDYLAVKMFEAGEGWFNNLEPLTVPSGSFTVDLSGLSNAPIMINAVRYLVNNVYVDLEYDSQQRGNLVKDSTDLTQYPKTYRLINGNKIYFNPAPSVVGADHVQVEYTSLPAQLADDSSVIDSQFNNALLKFVKFRSASICMSTAGKTVSSWKEFEAQWYEAAIAIISKRNRKTVMIRDFDSL